MKLNMAVRLRNPVFWLTLLPALTGLVYTVLGLLGVVPPLAEENLLQGAGLLITALTTLGVLVDPTTAGVGDSPRAMTYTRPVNNNGE